MTGLCVLHEPEALEEKLQCGECLWKGGGRSGNRERPGCSAVQINSLTKQGRTRVFFGVNAR